MNALDAVEGTFNFLLNLLFVIFGGFAIALCVTIIGIPLETRHFKLMSIEKNLQLLEDNKKH